MFILRKSYGWTYQAIGRAFGFDHATAMHAVSGHSIRMGTVFGYCPRFESAQKTLNA